MELRGKLLALAAFAIAFIGTAQAADFNCYRERDVNAAKEAWSLPKIQASVQAHRSQIEALASHACGLLKLTEPQREQLLAASKTPLEVFTIIRNHRVALDAFNAALWYQFAEKNPPAPKQPVAVKQKSVDTIGELIGTLESKKPCFGPEDRQTAVDLLQVQAIETAFKNAVLREPAPINAQQICQAMRILIGPNSYEEVSKKSNVMEAIYIGSKSRHRDYVSVLSALSLVAQERWGKH